MPLSELAARLRIMSEEYIALALEYLELRGPFENKSSDIVMDGRAESLRINFFFPHLPDPAVQMLLTLRAMRLLNRSASEWENGRPGIKSSHHAEQEGLRSLVKPPPRIPLIPRFLTSEI